MVQLNNTPENRAFNVPNLGRKVDGAFCYLITSNTSVHWLYVHRYTQGMLLWVGKTRD